MIVVNNFYNRKVWEGVRNNYRDFNDRIENIKLKN